VTLAETATPSATLPDATEAPSATPTLSIPTLAPPGLTEAPPTLPPPPPPTATFDVPLPPAPAGQVAPEVRVSVNGFEYTAIAISGQLVGAGGQAVTFSQPLESATLRINAPPGSTALLVFPTGAVPASVSLFTGDGATLLGVLTPIGPDLYQLPANVGSYTLAVRVDLPTASVIYYFRLIVVG
jgi:hypothetical protein